MNFRAAKSEPKMKHLRSDGWKLASTLLIWGQVGGQGGVRKRLLESAEV